jgi:hypothetical protein
MAPFRMILFPASTAKMCPTMCAKHGLIPRALTEGSLGLTNINRAQPVVTTGGVLRFIVRQEVSRGAGTFIRHAYPASALVEEVGSLVCVDNVSALDSWGHSRRPTGVSSSRAFPGFGGGSVR